MNPSTQKGRILERIVAAMYESPGITVKTNVDYPTTDGKDTREVDILLTANLEGLPVEYIFQCKNELKPIGEPILDGFVGHLNDIGVQTKYAIFVCVNGFTKPAIAYAKRMGFQLLVLKGLSQDRLRSEIRRAIQHQIYLIPRLKTFNVENAVRKPEFDWQFLTFTDENKRSVGIVPDLIFNKWRNGEVPEQLGDHTFELEVPQGWFQFHKGKKVEAQKIMASVSVLAVVITVDGQAENHLLLNPETRVMERSNTFINFNGFNEGEVVPLEVFSTESDLNDFIEKSKDARLTIKTRLPRIIINDFYYPLSENVAPIVFGQISKYGSKISKKVEENLRKEILQANEDDLFREGKVSLIGKEVPVICTGNDGETVDIKLLFDKGEYDQVIALKEKFFIYPSRAFGDLLAWSYLEKSRHILNKSKGKKGTQAQRLIEESRAKANAALEIVPGFIPAIDQLSHISFLEKDYAEALKAIDYILKREPQHVHVWIKRSAIEGQSEDWPSALSSLDKAKELEEIKETKTELFPLLLFRRAIVLKHLEKYSEAMSEMLQLWRFNPVATMSYVGFDNFIDDLSNYIETAEGLLMYVEVLYFRSSAFTNNNKLDVAEQVANEAFSILRSMTATDNAPAESRPIGVLNEVEARKVLKRCMRLLVKSGNTKLATEHKKKINKWFQDLWGNLNR